MGVRNGGSLVKNRWNFYYSENMPNAFGFKSGDRESVEFDWKAGSKMEPHMLMFRENSQRPLTWNQIIFDYSITTISGNPRFAQNECFTGNGVGVAGCENEPCTFGFLLQRNKDDLTDRRPFYRWWSRKRELITPNASGRLIVSFKDPESDWTSYPHGWKNFPSNLNAAVDNVFQFGLAFGGNRGYAHGVNIFDGDVKFRADISYGMVGDVVDPIPEPEPIFVTCPTCNGSGQLRVN